MSLSRQFVPKTVSDYDQEEAVVQSAMAGRLLNSGLPCRLTPEGQARAHRELADIRYRRVAAVIMGEGLMSVVELLPPMPDLGAPKKIPHPNLSDEEMVNIAAIVRVAREVRSPQSIRFYRAFCAAWDGLRVGEGSDTAKQTEAMRQALSAVGKRLDFYKLDAGAQ